MDESYLTRINQIHKFYNDPRMNEVRQFYNTPSFWQILNIARRENSHSAFIGYYLNPSNHHSLGNSFLKLFLQIATIRSIEQEKCQNDEFAQKIMLAKDIVASYIKPEEFMQREGEKGRFDIFMKCVIPSYRTLTSDSDDTDDDLEFIVVIENKVSAKETRKNGRGQTEKYKEYICEKYPELHKLFILLSPDRNSDISTDKRLDIKCDDFIRMSYQDLLTEVIEPILGNEIPDQEDAEKLKDYIKCLSIPALEDEQITDRTKSIIMAMSSKETKLLMDFWNNNEDLIKACLSAIAGNEEFSEEARAVASQASTTNFHRDTTKYSLGEGSEGKESRSSLVPLFIERWANINGLGGTDSTADKTLRELTKAFPGSLRGGKSYREEIIYKTQPNSEYKDRNFPSIKVGEYIYFVAANIWTKERFSKFMQVAEKLSAGNPDLKITEQ